MSTTNQTSMDIFREILNDGKPVTLYSANAKTRIPIGTIHRHFKQLEKTERIRVYESVDTGRKKIKYGPTIYGMIHFYRTDKEIAQNIENYFLLWIDNKEFQKELDAEGFDISPRNLKRSRGIFRKYMDYFSAVEDQIEKIRTGQDSISHDMQIFLGSMMLSSSSKYQKLWAELYNELPGMQKSLDEYMKSMIASYKEFKKRKNSQRQSSRRLKQKQ